MLENYQAKKGVLKIKPKNQAEIFLNMAKEEMRLLTAEECAEGIVILSQYTAYLQDLYNQEIARVHWLDAEIERIVAPLVIQYKADYQPYEERKNLAIDGNDRTKELMRLKKYAQSAADRLFFMSNRIEVVTKAYTSLMQTKRKWYRQDAEP